MLRFPHVFLRYAHARYGSQMIDRFHLWGGEMNGSEMNVLDRSRQ